MEAGEVLEAWTQISQWYRQGREAHAPQTKDELDEVTEERVELYRSRPLEGLKVPLLVQKADIEDRKPTVAEVVEAVQGLKGGRAGGTSGIMAEDLKGCMREATCRKYMARRSWELLVRLVHRMFRDGNPPKEIKWATMVLISKGKGEFQGIGLVEVMWKVYATVVNCWLMQGVVLHNTLQGFRGDG